MCVCVCAWRSGMWGLRGRREKGRTLGNTFCKKKKQRTLILVYLISSSSLLDFFRHWTYGTKHKMLTFKSLL